MEDGPAVVIDCGSYTCKSGFAGEDAPRLEFPTLVGALKDGAKLLPGMEGSATVVGAAAEGGVYKAASPMARGRVTDWDALEAVWEHAIIR